MFSSVLVANRGEIACRVFRTAQRLGLRTIAVYSDADADALHVALADEAVRVGPAPARESYLNVEAVLAAARQTGAEAIHPGYGFLSENAEFAEAVMAAGLVWIGPPPKAIRAMGLKDAAKRLMAEAGVPVTPGYLGEDQSLGRLTAEAEAVGYPVLIKAVAGGGGKGMKKVERPEDFADALASAQREAKAAFSDDRVLIEKYVTRPRHIEVQVFADAHGQVVHLFERDCSLQRRHQKVIEEAPAPGMDADTREAVTQAAIRAARAVDYVGAGTVEFIADASEGLRADRTWFMEMNTRLQVEHPVTEAVTGVDLVEWQLRIAAGQPLPLSQDQIGLNGWAMEARLYAEDPETGFLPSIGPLDHFVLPAADDELDDAGAGGATLRVDAGVEEGGEVSQFYDPMIAKLIAHAQTRDQAAARLAEACREVEVWPVRTNAAFLARCLDHARFVRGDLDTGFIAAEAETLLAPWQMDEVTAAAAAGALLRQSLKSPAEDADQPWSARSALAGFRLNGAPGFVMPVRSEEGQTPVRLIPSVEGGWSAEVGGALQGLDFFPSEGPQEAWFSPSVAVAPDRPPLSYLSLADEAALVVFRDGRAWRIQARAHAGAVAGEAADGSLRAPMHGRIVATPVSAGQTVSKGQAVVVLEAMKMEHALTAPFDGTVAELQVATGDQVAESTVLARVERA